MKNILVLSMTSWKGNYLKSTVELSREMAGSHSIFFVDYQYTLKDVMLGILGKTKTVPWKQMLGMSPRIQKEEFTEGRSLLRYTPWPIIPSFWAPTQGLFHFINRINHYLVFKPLRKHLRKRNFAPDIILTALNPFMGLGVKRFFSTIPHVYYCYDEIGSAHWLKKFGSVAEAALLPRLDGAVFSSDYLARKKGSPIKQLAVVKNGVHARDFSRHRRSVKPNKPPRVGYIGSIDDRFDINLMEAVIKAMPHVDFRFTGRVVDDRVPKRLSVYENVVFHPAVNPEDVPPLMGQLDIGIIPYVRNSFTQAVYPLKVNEYLAAGLQVIMTSFAELPDFHGYVELADTAGAFQSAISKLLAEDSEEELGRRIAFAEANSWKNRAGELLMFLDQRAADAPRP